MDEVELEFEELADISFEMLSEWRELDAEIVWEPRQ